MCWIFWGLFLWCFSLWRNPIASVSSLQWYLKIYLCFVTLVGFSHWLFFRPFTLGLHFIGAGRGVPSESLVQQPESKLFHVLFIPAFHPGRMMSLDVFIFLQWYVWFEHKSQIFSTLPLSISVGRTEFKLAFRVVLSRWLLLSFCSVKQLITSGDFCTCFKWLWILRPSIQVFETVWEYSLLTSWYFPLCSLWTKCCLGDAGNCCLWHLEI